MKKLIIIIIGAICMTVFSLTAYADVSVNSGLYISNEMGEDNAHFLELTAIDTYIPANSEMNFYFAGNQSNFETWSGPLNLTDGRINLNNVGEIVKSNRIILKVELKSTSQYSPVIKGYKITYDIGGTTSEINQDVNVNSLSSINNTSGAASVSSLVSTGTSIWLYLSLALIVSIVVGYLILRDKKNN